jgi:MFS transporter, FLVCR family, MFS-domain-containing protein 7
MADYRVYRHRWGILFLIVPIIVSSEIFWLTFAPVAGTAAAFFHTNYLGVDLFSMSYLIMYIIMTMPASWVIEKFGFRTSLVIGSLLTVLFGAARYFFAGNYSLVLAAQFLIAAGQPFLVNVSTKVPANWFPVEERSTASGILVMAQYIGFMVPMAISPLIVDQNGIKAMLGIYAAIAFLAALPAVFFTREKPAVPPGPPEPVASMSFKTIGKLLLNRNFVLVLILSFISMGLFNTLVTKIEPIFSPRGISATQAGIIGAVLVISGIAGAVILPLISDKTQRRLPFFIIGVTLLGILCAGLTYFTALTLLILTGAMLGFVIMGLAPILFQHGAEVAYPVQEGASFGLIMLMGQVSGILFIYFFEIIQNSTHSIELPMIFLMILAALQIPVAISMKDSAVFISCRAAKSPPKTR